MSTLGIEIGLETENKSRVSVHDHIRHLGVTPNGVLEPSTTCGLVGQNDAREAANLVVDLINSKRFGGRAVLIAGPPGTGKSAIAIAMSKSLGSKVPFTFLSASEVFSSEVKKTEILMENVRRSIGLRLREVKHVYEGELMELNVQEVENPHGGLAKATTGILITLRTLNGTNTLKLSPEVHKELVKERVNIGDVIYIQAQGGLVSRLGRCDVHSAAIDLETEDFIPLPKGDVYKTRTIVHDVTLHDLDASNGNPAVGTDLASIVSQHLAPRKTEITDRLREEVDGLVMKQIENGTAELTPGVLFIDECHLLDLECYAFLNRIVESENSPTVILATNRGMSQLYDSLSDNRQQPLDVVPHGIPTDFLDRLTIIKTCPYSVEEGIEILSVRAESEGIELELPALTLLGNIGAHASLRYAVQLMTPALVIANLSGQTIVTAEHVQEVDSLFLDAKSSAKRCADLDSLYQSHSA